MSVDGSAHEAEPTNLSVGISIKGMTKVYNRRVSTCVHVYIYIHVHVHTVVIVLLLFTAFEVL